VTAGDWEVFEDWCTATGRPALPTTWATVQNFLADVPSAATTTCRRLGAIRAHHRQARAELAGAPPRAPTPTPWHPPGEPVDPQPGDGAEDGPRWWDLGDALHHLPVHGYPHGVVARRDAVVLVLAARGWTRRRITALTPDQVRIEPVPGIDQVDLPMTSHGLTCPSCTLTRWLRVLATWYDTSGPAEDSTALIADAHPADVRLHDCATPVPHAWQLAPYLLPVIDRYGRIALGTRIPLRRVTTIVHARQRPSTSHESGYPQPAAAPARPAPSPAERIRKLRDIDEVLDRLDVAILDANQRWHDTVRALEP